MGYPNARLQCIARMGQHLIDIIITSVDPGDELPFHNLAIAIPVFAILDGTPSFRISMGDIETVGNGTHRSKSRVVR
jgi:hypothetical protein